MAFTTQGDEVLLRIVTQAAPRTNVMHLELVAASAILAVPTVALKHLAVEQLVGLPREAKTRTFLTLHFYAGIFKQDEKACFSSSGRSSYSRYIERSMVLGVWLSSPAPAKKSAQIISKQ